MWTYAELKAARAALSPVPLSDDAAAITLNAQTYVSAPQDVPTRSVLAFLLTTGEWGGIEAAAQPGSGVAQVIKIVSINLVRTCTTQVISEFHTSDAGVRNTVIGALGALQKASLLSAASNAALAAMITPSLPVWQPPVTAADVTTAKAT